MITVISLFEPRNDSRGVYIDTTSKSICKWTTELSPFHLGPCKLYGNYSSKNVENGWQYTKVYDQFIDVNRNPTKEYFDWAIDGWNNIKAQRYPMGKGSIPQYSYWDGIKYNYIDARKNIYVPLYANSVIKTNGYAKLKELINSNINIYLMDYDAYRHRDLNMTLTDVLNYPTKKMGHAFVLMMLLTNDSALTQCRL